MDACHVFVTSTSFLEMDGPHLDLLKDHGMQVVPNPYGRYLNEEEMEQLSREADAVIVGVEPVTRSVIEAAPRLRVISKYGVGYDNIDLVAAADRNIPVTYTPGVNADAVAELTIGLLFTLARAIPFVHAAMRNREWHRPMGQEIAGKILGIIGLGQIGKGVAQRALSLNMKVLAYDKVRDEDFAHRQGIAYTDLSSLLEQSDFVTLHLTLNEETRNLLTEERLRQMKKGSFLINAARGELVDEDALFRVLESGHLRGAALDVYREEPPFQSPLLDLDNIIFTSHIASKTTEAVQAQAFMAAENVIAILGGCREDATIVPSG